MVDEVQLELGSVEAPNPYATQSILPDSPYDEEVAFDLNEDDDADTAPSMRRRRRGQKAPQQVVLVMLGLLRVAAQQEQTASTADVGMRETIKPRPSSAAPSRVVSKQSPEKLAQSRELAATRAAAKGPGSLKKTGPKPC